MLNDVKEKILELIDMKNDKLPVGFYVTITIIASLIAKILGFNGALKILVVMNILSVIATVVEIRYKRINRRNIKIFLSVTLFSFFMTAMVCLIQYFAESNNDDMFAVSVKVFVSVIALCMDILGIAFIINKSNSKVDKVKFIFIMLFINMIAIITIMVFPPKGM